MDDGFNALPFKVKSEPLDEDYTIGSADILRFLDSRKGRLNHGKDDNGEDNISLESGEGVEAVYYNEDSDPSEPEPTKRKRKRKAQPAKPAGTSEHWLYDPTGLFPEFSAVRLGDW